MTHLTDNYLKKIFKIIYNYIVGSDPNFDISDLFDDSNVYEDIYMFIQDKLSHTDSDEVDFIYASFSRNWEMYGSSFPEIYGEVIKPELYNEYYHHNTYLPVMLEYMINEYQIDEDNVETDIRDTWDHQININEKK
jgi:hypothetical protein